MPKVGSKVRAETNSPAAQSVIIEVTKIQAEVTGGWMVYGYRQYKNRCGRARQTMYPQLYFVPKADA